MIKLIVELNGVDVDSGNDICLSKRETNSYENDLLLYLIDEVLTEGARLGGGIGLEGLRAFHSELCIAVSGDEDEGVRPAFALDARTISRLCSAGASLAFDPYV